MIAKKWFSPSGKSAMSLAFMAQRITGIVLVIYLCTHFLFLSSLSDESLYEKLTSVTLSREFLVFDLLLVLAAAIHGVNGVRIILHELGFAYEMRKAVLILSALVAILAWMYASYVMISLAR